MNGVKAAVPSLDPAARLRPAPYLKPAHQNLADDATIHICDLELDAVSLAELRIDLAMPDEQPVSSRCTLAV